MLCLMKYRYITATLLLLATVVQTAAQALTDRYTSRRPVVVTCLWDDAPYEFLNDEGEPAGINVDIVKAVMEELDLPCTFVMKDWSVAKNIFENGEADLILADENIYKKASSFFVSENVITYERKKGYAVAEHHFISRDRQLIDQIDDQYSRLKQKGDIATIQDRWLHPERVKPDTTPIILNIVITLLLFAALLCLFIWVIRRHVKSVTRNSRELNEMMIKALHMGNFDVMVYDIAKDHATNMYGNVLPKEGMTLAEYIQRIHPDDREEFVKKSKSLHEGRLRHFEHNKRWNHGTEANPHYLSFQGHAICELDDEGRPAYVINAVNDVTREVEIYQATRNIVHKYETILNHPFVPMSFYDSKGVLIDHNEAMKAMLHGIDESLFKEISKPEEHQNMRVTRHLYYPEYGIDKYVECHIQALYNPRGEVTNYLVTTSDRTPTS